MSTHNLTQRFTVLSLLVTLILTGCGIFSTPAAEEAQLGDKAAVIETESRVEAPDSAPAEEKIVVAVDEIAKEAVPATGADAAAPADGSESGYRSSGEIAGSLDGGSAAPVEAMPLATGTPAPTGADPDVVVESFAEGRLDEAPALERESDVAVVAPEIRQAEPLKAGEVDDNAQWDDYLLYRRDYRGPRVHDRDISERYIIEVTDGQGRPVLGANVRFYLPGQQREEIYSARTYATGRTLFHPRAMSDLALAQVDSFVVEVQKDNLLEQFSLTRFEAQAATAFTDRWTVTMDLPQQQLESLNLDVLFLVDATGSMADEIAKIQSTIFDVSAQIDALPEHPSVRYGMVTYRDRGDSFVTRSYEFTPDVRDFAQDLNTVFAEGGDDYPEALNEALHEAIHGVEWRGDDTVQLVFLIADAPPHLDYAQDFDYAEEMEVAARRGIKIFPIASSGLDDQGEYIFRQLAQFTEGRFIFLTYEGPSNGGAPGAETTHHVEDYSVENLDDLLVRLVEEELAHQNPQLVRTQ
jgi:Mg-chelatase subunit ChlD